MKSKHINWTQGLKCDHPVWPWPLPWPFIFNVKYGICFISTKWGPIATKRKETYRLNSRSQMWPVGLSLAMALTFEFSRSHLTLTFDHTHGPNLRVLCIFRKSCISECNGWFTLNKGGGSRSFMTITVTIQWLRSGIKDQPDSDQGDFSCRHAVNSPSCYF